MSDRATEERRARAVQRIRVSRFKHQSPEFQSYLSDLAVEFAEAEARAAVTQWQPIETAPKDWTVVMVWWPIGDWPSGNHAFAVYVDFKARIPAGTYYGEPYRSGWCNDSDGAYLPAEPTHWMPLPDPPSAGDRPASPEGARGMKALSLTQPWQLSSRSAPRRSRRGAGEAFIGVHWRFTQRRVFRVSVKPILCRGMLGLWTVPPEIEEQIHQQEATG